jgi:hypothetical protein
MRRRLLTRLIWLVCLIGLIACQEKKLYREYYPNGSMKVEGQVKDSVLHGEYKVYYPSGKLKFTGVYQNGLIEGESQTYYESGKLKEKKHWHHGKLNGLLHLYYEDGRLEAKMPFINDQRKGKSVYYYPNGKLEGEYFAGTYYWPPKDSLREGILWYQEYDSLGKIKKMYHVVKITAQKEPALQAYRLNIELLGAENEKMDVYIGGFDENYRYLGGAQDTIRSDNLKATYLYKPTKKGINLIRGVIRDYKKRGKAGHGTTTWESNAYFTYSLNVE